MKLLLVDQAHECEALVDLAEIQDYFVVGAARMVKLNNAGGLFVELERPRLFVDTVDTAHIDQNVDELGTDLVVLDLHWVAIRSDIDLRDNIEQESFLYL